MPSSRSNTAMSDAISDVSGARTGVGPVYTKTPDQVRAAQLVLASVAADDPRAAAYDSDPAARTRLREALRALGIFNQEGYVQDARVRKLVGTGPRFGVRGAKAPGPREPSGRLSRSVRREKE